jgi:hypothetical protein
MGFEWVSSSVKSPCFDILGIIILNIKHIVL